MIKKETKTLTNKINNLKLKITKNNYMVFCVNLTFNDVFCLKLNNFYNLTIKTGFIK